MAKGCCIEGHTEKETLELTLRWMSAWSERLAKDLMSVQKALDCIGNDVAPRGGRDDMTKEELSASVGAMRALVHGLAHSVGESYRDDGEDVLPGLVRGFDRVVEQCDARKLFRTTYMRGDKTAVAVYAANVQKGDWLVFDVRDESVRCFHELDDCVFEVTFVGVVGHGEHLVVACFRRLEGHVFHRGDISDPRFREDSVVVR